MGCVPIFHYFPLHSLRLVQCGEGLCNDYRSTVVKGDGEARLAVGIIIVYRNLWSTSHLVLIEIKIPDVQGAAFTLRGQYDIRQLGAVCGHKYPLCDAYTATTTAGDARVGKRDGCASGTPWVCDIIQGIVQAVIRIIKDQSRQVGVATVVGDTSDPDLFKVGVIVWRWDIIVQSYGVHGNCRRPPIGYIKTQVFIPRICGECRALSELEDPCGRG